MPLTSTLPATHTSVIGWLTTGQAAGESNGATVASVRIVSNVPVSATLSHDTASALDHKPVVCTPQQP